MEQLGHHALRKYNKVLLLFLVMNFCWCVPSIAQNQELNSFSRFVEINYKLPDSLKNNCEWMYAIVKIKTDKLNRVNGYDFINEPSQLMRKSFKYLIGYRFSQSFKKWNQPVIFYFSIDNLKICNEKPGDKVYYAPNQVAQIITSYIYKVIKDEPKAIIIPGLIVKEYLPKQE